MKEIKYERTQPSKMPAPDYVVEITKEQRDAYLKEASMEKWRILGNALLYCLVGVLFVTLSWFTLIAIPDQAGINEIYYGDWSTHSENGE